MLKNTFLYQVVLHELKKQPFSAKQKVFVYRKLYALPSKTARFRNQNTACSNNFLLFSKAAFFTYKKPFIRTNLYLFPPKTTFFHPPPPIRTTLNLLSTKEYSCSFNLCSNSLRCKAGTSHRFKSLPAIPETLQFFA